MLKMELSGGSKKERPRRRFTDVEKEGMERVGVTEKYARKRL